MNEQLTGHVLQVIPLCNKNFTIFRWVCKNHHKTKYCVSFLPLEEGDTLRSMSVVPYLDDLHNPAADDEGQGQHSHYDESYSAGRETTFTNSLIIHHIYTKEIMAMRAFGYLIFISKG